MCVRVIEQYKYNRTVDDGLVIQWNSNSNLPFCQGSGHSSLLFECHTLCCSGVNWVESSEILSITMACVGMGECNA